MLGQALPHTYFFLSSSFVLGRLGTFAATRSRRPPGIQMGKGAQKAIIRRNDPEVI